MTIKEEHVLEFQSLYKEVFNEELSFEEAQSQCTDMVALGKIIYSPIYKEDLKLLKN